MSWSERVKYIVYRTQPKTATERKGVNGSERVKYIVSGSERVKYIVYRTQTPDGLAGLHL